MKRACLFALLLQTGCTLGEIRTSGCLQIGEEKGRASEVHLYKAGQPVPDDNLIAATADDPEAQKLARRSRQHAVAALPLGALGIVFTVVGAAVTADGGHGSSNAELAVGVPMAAVGVGALIAAAVELKKSGNRGTRAIELYNERHPACR